MNKLAIHLKQRGRGALTQLSEQTGYSKGYLSDIANGRTKPSLRAAFEIEKQTSGAVPVSSWNQEQTA